jgi:hypothetical protein
MSEFEKNNASELLTQLLDGELESANESVLFSALAADKYLFDELKQHLAIREAIRKDTEAFTPPPETVNAIFTSLGYRAPGVAPLPAAVISKSVVWGKYIRRAVPFALLLLGLFGSYSIFKSDSKVEETNSRLLNTDSKIETASVAPVKAGMPQIVSLEKSNINNNAVVIRNTKAKKQDNAVNLNTAIVSLNDNKVAINDLSENISAENASKINIQSVSMSSAVSNSIKPPHFMNNYSNINHNVEILPLRISGTNDLKLYVKSFSNFASDQFSSNIAVGVNFLNRDNFKIGAEAGNQQYRVMATNENNIIIEKPKNVFWGAVAFRYEFNELNFMFTTPYAQGSIGAGDFGTYLYRFTLGAEIIPLGNSTGINIGLESSNLRYTIEGNPYNANSLGVMIGLSWKF